MQQREVEAGSVWYLSPNDCWSKLLSSSGLGTGRGMVPLQGKVVPAGLPNIILVMDLVGLFRQGPGGHSQPIPSPPQGENHAFCFEIK